MDREGNVWGLREHTLNPNRWFITKNGKQYAPGPGYKRLPYRAAIAKALRLAEGKE